MSIYATKNERDILREFDALPQMKTGETIRMRMKPRASPSPAALCPITDEMLARIYANTPLDRVTSGRERSTE